MRKKTFLFIIALLIQGLILAAVPAGKIYTLKTGQVIKLKTQPVDPYDVLSGYFVTLNYEISTMHIPEDEIWKDETKAKNAWLNWKDNIPVFIVLAPDEQGVFNAKSIHKNRPEIVEPGDVIIKGRKSPSWRTVLEFGIESYYIPENIREQIGDDLRENRENAIVEVKVDRYGNAAVLRIIINDNTYEY